MTKYFKKEEKEEKRQVAISTRAAAFASDTQAVMCVRGFGVVVKAELSCRVGPGKAGLCVGARLKGTDTNACRNRKWMETALPLG